jgi:hypothetical protein
MKQRNIFRLNYFQPENCIKDPDEKRTASVNKRKDFPNIRY